MHAGDLLGASSYDPCSTSLGTVVVSVPFVRSSSTEK